MNKQFKRVGATLGTLALTAPAFAAIDTTAAVGGVTDAQTAIIVVLGAMITMVAAIFGLKKIKGLLGR